MKTYLAVVLMVGTAFGQQSKMDDNFELMRISASVAVRVCAQNRQAKPYMIDDKGIWIQVPCSNVKRVRALLDKDSMPDFYDQWKSTLATIRALRGNLEAQQKASRP